MQSMLCRQSNELPHVQEEFVQVVPQPVLEAVQEFCGVFTVAVSTNGCSTLGVQWEWIESNRPMILEIQQGAVQRFNEVHESSRVERHDVLIALDGIQSLDLLQQKMMKMCGELPDQLFLTVNRPKRVQVILTKAGLTGMKLAYSRDSLGVMVSGLEASGLIPEWNAKHISHAVSVGDRIIELNGRSYKGFELAKRLERQHQVKILTVLQYPSIQDDMPILAGLSRRSFFVWIYPSHGHFPTKELFQGGISWKFQISSTSQAAWAVRLDRIAI